MHNYKLVVSYDGTAYGGWQIQPNAVTIQEKLEEAFKVLIKEEVRVIGSGRTDAGVHAIAQVAHVKCQAPISRLSRFLLSVNALLPQDIRVREIEEVPLDFHAQYSALSKIYHYHLYLEPVMDPFQRRYCFHCHQKVSILLLKEAARLFIGTHDFTSFANSHAEGCAAQDAVRTLFRVDVVEESGGVRVELEGDGFLYKMVRNIIGTLIDVSSGKLSLEDVSKIFAEKDRRKAAAAVPASGLFLVKVNYSNCSNEE